MLNIDKFIEIAKQNGMKVEYNKDKGGFMDIENETNKKSETIQKEKQIFQLGDIAYCIDEDYIFYETEVFRISLQKGKYLYETRDVDFELKDVGDWVFKSRLDREIHTGSFIEFEDEREV